MASLNTVDKILTAFQFPTIPAITGEPDFYSLNEMQKLLETNAASIPSGRARDLGHLVLVVKPTTYMALTGNIAFLVPADPGPINNAMGTAAQIERGVREHKLELDEYNLYKNKDTALKQQLLGAIEPMYTRAL